MTTPTAAPATELAIRDDQLRFDKYQVAALRTRGIDNVPNAELAVFFHHCKSRGLDPFSGHATIVPFKERDGSRRWTIITEIDGFRYLGHRAARQRGDIIAMPDPVYVDGDGNETTYWVKPPTDPPAMVKQTILKNGAPFTGAANYWEFGHFDKNGHPIGMTRDMPANQTAKCAEAQAWRKAYQDVFADLPLQFTVQPTASPAAAAETWHAAAIEPEPATTRPEQELARVTHKLDLAWEALGVTSPDEQINLTGALAGIDPLEIDAIDDLPIETLQRVADRLAGCKDIGQVHALIDRGDKPGGSDG